MIRLRLLTGGFWSRRLFPEKQRRNSKGEYAKLNPVELKEGDHQAARQVERACAAEAAEERNERGGTGNRSFGVHFHMRQRISFRVLFYVRQHGPASAVATAPCSLCPQFRGSVDTINSDEIEV